MMWRNYIIQGVIMRDMDQPIPPWMKRVQIWALNDQFVVNCGFVSPEEATELVVEALLRILHNRGREAEPIHDEKGEVRGIKW